MRLRNKQYTGEYIVRELSAQEGIEAIDILIAENPRLQENPDEARPDQIRKKEIELATTLDGKPLHIEDLTKFPSKLWKLLVGANEMLNGVSIREARFLLSPSGRSSPQSIPQSSSGTPSTPSASG